MTTATPKPDAGDNGCALISGHRARLKACTGTASCGVCMLQPLTRIALKGLCKWNTDVDKDYDIFYYVRGQMNGQPHFNGIMNSHIYFDDIAETWRLQSLRNPQRFVLLSNNVVGALPLGTKKWTVGSDEALCGYSNGTELDLTFSTCFPNKFTCNDGTCIPLG